MSKISIVLVTYNSTKHIYDCIDSIYKNNDLGDDLEVIIVDNESEEQQAMFTRIRELYGDKILLASSGKNGGYGFGNNVGFSMSSSPIVIVMNPDVRIVSPIFKDILKQFEDSSVGMIGVDYVDGSCPYYFKREHSTLINSLLFKFYVRRRKYDSKKMFMTGSFLVFKKEAFNKAGQFDENIFLYSEEADITNRILMSGYKAEWCPSIKVFHFAHGRSFNAYLDKVRLQSGLYYEKKYNFDSEKIYRATILYLRIKIIVSTILFKNEKKEFFKRMLRNLLEFHEENIQNYRT